MFWFRNILELTQFCEDGSCFYLVFEKLRGGKTEFMTMVVQQLFNFFSIFELKHY